MPTRRAKICEVVRVWDGLEASDPVDWRPPTGARGGVRRGTTGVGGGGAGGGGGEGEGGGAGEGGGGSGEGDMGGNAGGEGGGGGAAPQLTATCANAPSPKNPLPRVYSKANDAEKTPMLTACHASLWSPPRLHTASPAALVTRSSPMLKPYMW